MMKMRRQIKDYALRAEVFGCYFFLFVIPAQAGIHEKRLKSQYYRELSSK